MFAHCARLSSLSSCKCYYTWLLEIIKEKQTAKEKLQPDWLSLCSRSHSVFFSHKRPVSVTLDILSLLHSSYINTHEHEKQTQTYELRPWIIQAVSNVHTPVSAKTPSSHFPPDNWLERRWELNTFTPSLVVYGVSFFSKEGGGRGRKRKSTVRQNGWAKVMSSETEVLLSLWAFKERNVIRQWHAAACGPTVVPLQGYGLITADVWQNTGPNLQGQDELGRWCNRVCTCSNVYS